MVYLYPPGWSCLPVLHPVSQCLEHHPAVAVCGPLKERGSALMWRNRKPAVRSPLPTLLLLQDPFALMRLTLTASLCASSTMETRWAPETFNDLLILLLLNIFTWKNLVLQSVGRWFISRHAHLHYHDFWTKHFTHLAFWWWSEGPTSGAAACSVKWFLVLWTR